MKQNNNFLVGQENTPEYREYLIGMMVTIVVMILIICWFGAITFRGGYYDVEALDADYEVDYVVHTVEPGDSLSYIAEVHIGEYPGSFNEYMDLIAEENGITNRHYLVVGDKIRVPVYTEITD